MPSVKETESRLFIALLIFLMALGPISTDLYLPSLPSIAAELKADQAEIQLTLSVFLLGFATSQLIYGPLSDRFGRRPVFIGALVLYLLASLTCSFSNTIEELIILRFVQALGACAGPVLSRTIVRDVYRRDEAARIMSWMGMAMALAPAVGPVIGGQVEILFGWRANFLVLSGFSTLALLWLLLRLPETNRDLNMEAMQLPRLIRNYFGLLRNTRYMGYVLISTGSFSGIFCFISGSPFVLIDQLGLSPDVFGLYFAVIVVGYMAGTFLSAQFTLRLGLHRMIMIGSSVSFAGGLIAVGLSLFGELNLLNVVGPFAVFTIGAGLTFPNNMAAALAPFPRIAGSASALMGFIQMIFASGVGVLISSYNDGTALSMTASLAGVTGMAFASYVFLIHPHKLETLDSPTTPAI